VVPIYNLHSRKRSGCIYGTFGKTRRRRCGTERGVHIGRTATTTRRQWWWWWWRWYVGTGVRVDIPVPVDRRSAGAARRHQGTAGGIRHTRKPVLRASSDDQRLRDAGRVVRAVEFDRLSGQTGTGADGIPVLHVLVPTEPEGRGDQQFRGDQGRAQFLRPSRGSVGGSAGADGHAGEGRGIPLRGVRAGQRDRVRTGRIAEGSHRHRTGTGWHRRLVVDRHAGHPGSDDRFGQIQSHGRHGRPARGVATTIVRDDRSRR